MLNVMMLPGQMMMTSFRIWQEMWAEGLTQSMRFFEETRDEGEEMAEAVADRAQEAGDAAMSGGQETAEAVNWAGQDALKAATEVGVGKV